MMRALALLLLASCGTSTAVDAAVPVDAGAGLDLAAPESACGAPGDPGNSIGVGLFCVGGVDCIHNSAATICSSILNDVSHPLPDDTYFCTVTCVPDGGGNTCAENAYCTCLKLGCGCVPSRCSLPDGGFNR